tara:strand:- start:240 stop:359 length:120 start_codon:yes stop_codon:yes gene_type:complete
MDLTDNINRGIVEINRTIPTIEAQFREALTMKKVFISLS